MKRTVVLSLMALVGVVAVDATAQDLLPAPNYAPQSYEVAPTPAVPQSTLPPVPQAYPPAPYYPLSAAAPVVLYQNVRVKDARKIHPLAVPTIVEVPDPRDRHCTVCIEICAPPCECVKVRRHGLLGRKVEFDYGKYEIDVTSRRGLIVIDYDA